MPGIQNTRRAIAVLVVLTLAALAAGPAGAQVQWQFERGNANGDGGTDIADAIGILDHLFQGAPTTCFDALDANDDGSVNIADAIALLDNLFGTGQPLPPPFGACGPDPTPDMLTCDGPTNCAPAGCIDNVDCPSGEYCMTAPGNCGGVGECMPMPMICTAVYDPVCGCDGNVYGNACEAAAVGVSVDVAGDSCPCSDNSGCAANEYCAKAVGDCNGIGTCTVRPVICPLIFDPQCGCDGNTYDNACVAAANGINVNFPGFCP